MKSFAAVAVLAAASSALAQFTINTPSGLLQCVTAQITFSGGTGPFFLSINTPDANGSPLQTYDGITGSPFQWSANISANIQLGLSLTDRSNGDKALSGPFTLGDSGDSSCLNGGAASSAAAPASSGSESASASSGSAASSGASSAAVTSATSATGVTSAATGVTTSATVGTTSRGSSVSGSATHSSSGSAASASGTAGTSGASSNSVSAGVLGVVGAVAVLVMA